MATRVFQKKEDILPGRGRKGGRLRQQGTRDRWSPRETEPTRQVENKAFPSKIEQTCHSLIESEQQSRRVVVVGNARDGGDCDKPTRGDPSGEKRKRKVGVDDREEGERRKMGGRETRRWKAKSPTDCKRVS